MITTPCCTTLLWKPTISIALLRLWGATPPSLASWDPQSISTFLQRHWLIFTLFRDPCNCTELRKDGRLNPTYLLFISSWRPVYKSRSPQCSRRYLSIISCLSLYQPRVRCCRRVLAELSNQSMAIALDGYSIDWHWSVHEILTNHRLASLRTANDLPM